MVLLGFAWLRNTVLGVLCVAAMSRSGGGQPAEINHNGQEDRDEAEGEETNTCQYLRDLQSVPSVIGKET